MAIHYKDEMYDVITFGCGKKGFKIPLKGGEETKIKRTGNLNRQKPN